MKSRKKAAQQIEAQQARSAKIDAQQANHAKMVAQIQEVEARTQAARVAVLRDRIANDAMIGYLVNGDHQTLVREKGYSPWQADEVIAKHAYELADAMLKAREANEQS